MISTKHNRRATDNRVFKVKPSYVSSNVIPDILSPYDKIIDKQIAITVLSDVYMTSNGINYLYISSNNYCLYINYFKDSILQRLKYKFK